MPSRRRGVQLAVLAQIRLDDLWCAAHLVGLALCDGSAAVHCNDAVREGRDELDLMLDEQNRMPLRLEILELLKYFRRPGLVHAGGRLVEQQQLRLADVRAGDLGATAVRIRQCVGEIVATSAEPFPEPVDFHAHAVAHIGTLAPHLRPVHQRDRRFGEQIHPPQQRIALQLFERTLLLELFAVAECDVLVHGERAEHAAVLECARQTMLAHGGRARPCNGLFVNVDDARVRCQESRNQIDRGRFS